MSAALFVLEGAAAATEGATVRLTGPEGRHAVSVARVGVGEQVDLTDGLGTLLRTRVEALSGRDTLDARVLERVVVAPPQPRIVAVQAVPKGDRGELAVELLTEVGVDVIVPWMAQRCIARWSPDRAERGRGKWAAAARAACKQSRRAWFPDVAPVAQTAEVRQRVAAAQLAVVLHEEAGEPLSRLPIPSGGDVVLVIGPEGGVAPAEIAALTGAGAALARLGPSVLRTSTAGAVAAGVVLARSARWA